jgi:hypothetical protein
MIAADKSAVPATAHDFLKLGFGYQLPFNCFPPSCPALAYAVVLFGFCSFVQHGLMVL